MTEAPPSVLILDDDDAVRESLFDYFEDRGWRVWAAASAEEALDMLPGTKPDAAIVDIRLPGQDGNAFIRKAAAAYPELAVVIVTGSPQYALPADVASMPCVADRVFNKPVRDMGILIRVTMAQIGICRETGNACGNRAHDSDHRR